MNVFALLGEILCIVVVFLKNGADGVYSPCMMWTSVCDANEETKICGYTSVAQ